MNIELLNITNPNTVDDINKYIVSFGVSLLLLILFIFIKKTMIPSNKKDKKNNKQ